MESDSSEDTKSWKSADIAGTLFRTIGDVNTVCLITDSPHVTHHKLSSQLTRTLSEAFRMLMLRTVHSLVISFCTLACLLSLHLIKAFIWSKPPGCKLVSSLGSLLFFCYFSTIFYLVSFLVSLLSLVLFFVTFRFPFKNWKLEGSVKSSILCNIT